MTQEAIEPNVFAWTRRIGPSIEEWIGDQMAKLARKENSRAGFRATPMLPVDLTKNEIPKWMGRVVDHVYSVLTERGGWMTPHEIADVIGCDLSTISSAAAALGVRKGYQTTGNVRRVFYSLDPDAPPLGKVTTEIIVASKFPRGKWVDVKRFCRRIDRAERSVTSAIQGLGGTVRKGKAWLGEDGEF